jgi:hypothetical protein
MDGLNALMAGHPRLFLGIKKGVDGRVKPGQDGAICAPRRLFHQLKSKFAISYLA